MKPPTTRIQGRLVFAIAATSIALHLAGQTLAGETVISPCSCGDDTASIRRAIAISRSGAIRFQAGVYNLYGSLRLRGNLSYTSARGSWDAHNGSVLVQNTPGAPIFAVDGQVYSANVTGLTFDGAPGTNAKGVAGANSQSLLATSTIRDSYFLAGLAEGIDVAMVLTRIERNQFGVNGGGAVASTRRHIHSTFPQAAQNNANWVVGNLFRSAQGTESVLFESGAQLHIEGNDFEANNADTTLRIHGMYHVVIEGNWFEQNHGQAQMMFGNAQDTGNYIVRLENNHYNLAGFGAPNTCAGNVVENNCYVFMYEPNKGTATHVYMGYETATNFSPVTELTANELTITGYLCLRGYSGTQAGQFNNVHEMVIHRVDWGSAA